MKLDLGIGKYPIEGFVHIDKYPYPGVGILGDATRLPFADNSIDEFIASHIIEHFPWWKVQPYVAEWYRTIKPGGYIEVQTYDIHLLYETYQSGNLDKMPNINPDEIPGIWLNRKIFWWEEMDCRIENVHKAIYDFPYLKYLLESVGFHSIVRLPIEQTHTFRHGNGDMLVKGNK